MNILVRNYTESLFLSAKELDSLDAIFYELKNINDVINFDHKVQMIMVSPIVKKTEKLKLVEFLHQKLKISQLSLSFLILLVKNFRLNLLSSIVLAYHDRLNDFKNIKAVKITSAKMLGDQDKKYLVQFLEKKLNKKIELSFNMESSIIGGILINYDSYLLDYSLKGAITKIAKIANSYHF